MTDEQLIELVDTCDEWADRPVATASEIAEMLNVTRQAVHKRLEQLHERGEIRKYKPGRSAVWWRD